MANLKKIMLRTASSLHVPQLFNRLLARNRLAVLMYHGITARPLPVPDWCFIPAADFHAQMEYLAQHCRVLPLTEALSELHAGKPAAGRPAVTLTFDDGYQNNHDIALPILREFNLPATIFLSTAFIGTTDWLWFCRLHSALSETKKNELTWRGEFFSLHSVSARAAASSRLQAILKEQPHDDLLRETAELIRSLDVDPLQAAAPESPFRFLNQASINACLQSGLITFGAHTHRHTILSLLDEAAQRAEIARSIHDVETLTSQPCKTFAYPNGRECDYDETSTRILAEEKIEYAVTTREFGNQAQTNPLQLGRYGIGYGDPLASVECRVHHFLNN